MKKVSVFIGTIFLFVSLHAQTEYSISGKVPAGYPSTMAVMSYPPDDRGGEYKSDTVIIKNGAFKFQGIITRPQMAELNLVIPRPAGSARGKSKSDTEQNLMKNVALFYLDGTINVSFDTSGMASYTGGGLEQQGWRDYENMVIAKNKASKGASAGIEFYYQIIAEFVKSHPDSYVSVDLMDLMTQSSIQYNVVAPVYNSLTKRMQNSEKVLGWVTKLEEAKLALSGTQTAPVFIMNDIQGKPVSLASYKGSYVLVDFWASWCAPCRAENPNVLAAYKKYKDKNFQVLGVSLDEKRSAWMKAVTEDKLPWKQLCDFQAANSEINRLYNLKSIPANVLINPDGKIVGKDLRGEYLHERLAELLN